MKRIGLVGGLSPELTVRYCEILCRRYNRRRLDLQFRRTTRLASMPRRSLEFVLI
jgi:aspartate/glutamate racemase